MGDAPDDGISTNSAWLPCLEDYVVEEMIPRRELTKLLDVVLGLTSEQHGPFWFRGQPDVSKPLVPKIHRGGADRRREVQCVHEFRRRAVSRSSKCPGWNDHASWLSLMQHFGLPTRLLDWTDSLLVALYFAVKGQQQQGNSPDRDGGCGQSEESDGIVWILDPGKMNAVILGGGPGALVEPRVLPLDPDIVVRTPEQSQAPVIRQMVDPAFDEGLDTGPFSALAVAPAEHDPRLVVQQAAFTIHRDDRALDTVQACASFLTRVRIPPSMKASLEKQLRDLNVRESVLFPDLDHLSGDVVRYVKSVSGVRRPLHGYELV